MESSRTLVAPEGKSDQTGAEGGVGLTSEEIANRLYPKLPEPRRVEPSRKVEEKPVPAPAPSPPFVGSIVAKDAVFDGKIQTEGDLAVEGTVRGEIACKGKLQVAEGATVEASVNAAAVSVAGSLSGDVTCSDRFEALATATVRSHVKTGRLIIHDGAHLEGQISMGVAQPEAVPEPVG